MDSTNPPRRGDLRSIARRAMVERGLLPDFSPEILAEVQAMSEGATAGGGRDLRDRLWASIDNDDSRDLDQLSVAEALSGGGARILVAVADVDARVKKGSATDGHAAANTSSVYTAAEIFPMLPEKLSTDLTSLNADEDRLAIVVEMTVDADGKVSGTDVYRATVRNRAKLAYDSVAAWLDGNGPAPQALAAVAGLEDNLRLQNQMSLAMKELRHNRGALALETNEARTVFVGDVLQDLRPDEENRAKELIEDLMVAANGVVAGFLEKKGSPSLRRVLRTPNRWDRIVALAAEHGGKLPAQPDTKALATFLDERRRKDPDTFGELSLSVVKLLGAGEYELKVPGQEAPGHFALAVADYTHSTAPNRRFADLVAQRLLKAALAGAASPYSESELATIATHCNVQGQNAAKVERQVRKSAAALLLRSRVGDTFDGVVTGASDKGTWVRIDKPAAEGKVVRGFEGLDVGDRVRVSLLRTDVDRGFIDFARAGQR